MSWLFVSHSEEETLRLGEILAEALEPGMVVALVGPLGAGKTRLVKAVAEAAGVDRAQVNSPTFVLVQEYEGKWPIYHFDTYRIPGEQEFLDLGADEYFQSAGVCFVEWADRVERVLPADLWIEIEVVDLATRSFSLTARTARGEKMIASFPTK